MKTRLEKDRPGTAYSRSITASMPSGVLGVGFSRCRCS